MSKSFALALVAAAMLLVCPLADAQTPRYTPPAGSTLPRALNYFRRDVGVLDPYNAFIAPSRRLDSQLQQLHQRQEAFEREEQRMSTGLRRPAAAATGTGATFMNYSHYYKAPAGPRAIPRQR